MDKATAQRIVRETFKAPFDKKRYRDFTNELCNGHTRTEAGDVGTGIFDVFDRYNFTVNEENLLRSGSRVPAVLGILMYFTIHSGSSAPAERDLSSLATIYSQAPSGGYRSRF